MPVHRQKKCTTTHSTNSTSMQPTPPLPDQQEFHQYLRELARGGGLGRGGVLRLKRPDCPKQKRKQASCGAKKRRAQRKLRQPGERGMP